MTEQTPYIKLQESIGALERQQELQKELLRSQFSVTYEELKPVNLLKRSVQGAFELKGDKRAWLALLVPAAVGIIASKRIGKKTHLSTSPLGVLGNIGSYLINNPEVVATIGGLVASMFRKKRDVE